MTAINIIKHADCIHMLTDGAGYDTSGDIIFEAPKAWPLPNLPAVIAVRGPALLASIIVNLIGANGVRTYDDLPEKAANIAYEAEKTHRGLLGLCSFGGDFDFVFAGVLSDGAPHAGIVCNHERHGIPAYALTNLGELSLMPGTTEIGEKFRASYPHATSGLELDPAIDGLAILEMQRSEAVRVWGAVDSISIVGAFAQLTTVYRDRIETSVVKRWPTKAVTQRESMECVQ